MAIILTLLKTLCRGTIFTDMDGVLCKNPDVADIINPRYEEWMRSVAQYITPKFIPAIVTMRTERYRSITEEWLRRHNIHYDRLIMYPGIYYDNDRTIEEAVEFKSNILNAFRPDWFWESDDRQASAIHQCTKIKVLCIDSMKVYK